MLRRLVVVILIFSLTSQAMAYAKPNWLISSAQALPMISEREMVLNKAEVLYLMTKKGALSSEAKKALEASFVSALSDASEVFYLSKIRHYKLGAGASLEVGALLKVKKTSWGSVEVLALVDKWLNVKGKGKGASITPIFFSDLTKSYPTDSLYLKGYLYLTQEVAYFKTEATRALEDLGYLYQKRQGLRAYYDKSFSFDFLIAPQKRPNDLTFDLLAPLL